MCERNIHHLPLVHPEAGDLASNPGMCPDWELNWQPFGLQDKALSSEPPVRAKSTFLSALYFWKSPDSLPKSNMTLKSLC